MSAYPPQDSGYPPQYQNQGYPPQPQGYPPQAQGYPPQAQVYPPQGQPQGYSPYPQPGVNPGAYGYPPQGAPISQQPGVAVMPGAAMSPGVAMPPGQAPAAVVGMQVVTQEPTAISGCPQGLEYLSMLDQVLVKQKVELLEALTGFETNNKYLVLNVMGQQFYKAEEQTDCCTRNCCGPIRPFDLALYDNFGREVIHLQRPLRCQSCCFPCCLQEMEVTSQGQLLGRIEQTWSVFKPAFRVKDASGNVVLKIQGPFCTCSCGNDVKFQVLTADGDQEVGVISKQWTGFFKESLTDADNFGVTFPQDLDVRTKATLLGAVFLIDFMFFEKAANNESDRPGMLDL